MFFSWPTLYECMYVCIYVCIKAFFIYRPWHRAGNFMKSMFPFFHGYNSDVARTYANMISNTRIWWWFEKMIGDTDPHKYLKKMVSSIKSVGWKSFICRMTIPYYKTHLPANYCRFPIIRSSDIDQKRILMILVQPPDRNFKIWGLRK